jgi:predicted nucleic acid-binding Zn ribbon protein
MCGAMFKTSRFTGTKFCSDKCGERYRYRRKRYDKWHAEQMEAAKLRNEQRTQEQQHERAMAN